jgi:hypothetical protein
MKLKTLKISILFALGLGCVLFLGQVTQARMQQMTAIASDTSWKVQDSAGNDLGKAQAVCLDTAGSCPADTTVWGYGGNWGADISGLAGAKWIWAPYLTGETQPAYPAEYTFRNNFSLKGGTPVSGMISIAADDYAEVYVNECFVGSIGSRDEESLAANASSELHTFPIPCLNRGNNTITIKAANGNFGCGSGSYSCNPAGVACQVVVFYNK